MIEKSIFNVRKIFLILGTACNFNCLYCVQHENKPRCKKQIKPEVIDWLADLSYQLPECFKPQICFYGGEPLLYKEGIHQVVDRFGDSFSYSIISNGSYLTDEDVDYFNQHDIEYIFSHDGPKTRVTRQIDLFEDDAFVARFNRLKKRAVEAVYSAQSADVYGLFGYVESKSPGTKVWVGDLICNTFTPKELVDFDVPTMLNSYQRMGDAFDQCTCEGKDIGLDRGTKLFGHWLGRAIDRLKEPGFPQFGTCDSGRSMLSVDTEGNVYLCKNFNEKIGTVADNYETLYERAKVLTKRLRDRNLEQKGCFECSAFYFCRGGCPFEEASEAQAKKCDMLRLRWASINSFINNRLEIVHHEDSKI